VVQTTGKNLEIVKKFKERAARLVDVQRMIFFGSRSKGAFNEDSDFDLIIVSKDFEDRPFFERPAALHLSWEEEYPLELICYTPDELKKKLQNPYSIASEAVKAGISV